MDIEIRKQLEQLEYIKDKLEYIEYDEALGCYIEKQDGLPTGVAAWANGAFYGFEQAAKAHEAEKLKGCVVVPVEPTKVMYEAYARHSVAPMSTLSKTGYKAMLEAARGGNE